MLRQRFAPSERFAQEAGAAYVEHAGRIGVELPDAEVVHRGGTSVPGVLTSGDVDIHVRVAGEEFEPARDTLATLYEPFHREAWSAGESAFFFAPGSTPPVELALTVRGTVDDFHHGAAWDRIAIDTSLIARYNELKRRCERVSQDEYEAAKREFFAAIV